MKRLFYILSLILIPYCAQGMDIDTSNISMPIVFRWLTKTVNQDRIWKKVTVYTPVANTLQMALDVLTGQGTIAAEAKIQLMHDGMVIQPGPSGNYDHISVRRNNENDVVFSDPALGDPITQQDPITITFLQD